MAVKTFNLNLKKDGRYYIETVSGEIKEFWDMDDKRKEALKKIFG